MRVPRVIENCVKNGYIIGIIQFGSSTRRTSYKDIDLAIIVRKGHYFQLFHEIAGKKIKGFDISLIKEEEIRSPQTFRFGGHGLHFAESMKQGIVLFGINPFIRVKIKESLIQKSVIERLYDYIYDVRKAVFKAQISKDILRRWPKFLRLSLYLLSGKLRYPEVVDINQKKINYYLKQLKITLPKNILLAYEVLWEKILNKYKLL